MIGERIKARRIALSLSQKQLSALVNIRQPSLVKIEQGGNTEKVYEFAIALKTNPNWLLTGSGDADLDYSHQSLIAELIGAGNINRLSVLPKEQLSLFGTIIETFLTASVSQRRDLALLSESLIEKQKEEITLNEEFNTYELTDRDQQRNKRKINP